MSDVNSTQPHYHLLSGDIVDIVRSLSDDRITTDARHLFFNANTYAVNNSTNLVWVAGGCTNLNVSPVSSVATTMPYFTLN